MLDDLQTFERMDHRRVVVAWDTPRRKGLRVEKLLKLVPINHHQTKEKRAADAKRYKNIGTHI